MGAVIYLLKMWNTEANLFRTSELYWITHLNSVSFQKAIFLQKWNYKISTIFSLCEAYFTQQLGKPSNFQALFCFAVADTENFSSILQTCMPSESCPQQPNKPRVLQPAEIPTLNKKKYIPGIIASVRPVHVWEQREGLKNRITCSKKGSWNLNISFKTIIRALKMLFQQ